MAFRDLTVGTSLLPDLDAPRQPLRPDAPGHAFAYAHERPKARKYTHYFPIVQDYRLIFSDFPDPVWIREMLAHDELLTLHRTACPVLQPGNRSSYHRTTASSAGGSNTETRFRLLVREICNPVSGFSLRPTYREVTACGGTFPDTVTYLHGSNTLIGSGSSAARAAQALHLPDSGTFFITSRPRGRDWIETGNGRGTSAPSPPFSRLHSFYGFPISRVSPFTESHLLRRRSPLFSSLRHRGRETTSWPS